MRIKVWETLILILVCNIHTKLKRVCLLCKHSLMANLPASFSNQMASLKPYPTKILKTELASPQIQIRVSGVGQAFSISQQLPRWASGNTDSWGTHSSRASYSVDFFTLCSHPRLYNSYPVFSSNRKSQSFVAAWSWVKTHLIFLFRHLVNEGEITLQVWTGQ